MIGRSPTSTSHRSSPILEACQRDSERVDDWPDASADEPPPLDLWMFWFQFLLSLDIPVCRRLPVDRWPVGHLCVWSRVSDNRTGHPSRSTSPITATAGPLRTRRRLVSNSCGPCAGGPSRAIELCKRAAHTLKRNENRGFRWLLVIADWRRKTRSDLRKRVRRTVGRRRLESVSAGLLADYLRTAGVTRGSRAAG